MKLKKGPGAELRDIGSEANIEKAIPDKTSRECVTSVDIEPVVVSSQLPLYLLSFRSI